VSQRWWHGLVAGALLALGVAGATAVPAAAAAGYPDPGAVTGDVSVHDPSMIRAANGTYYLFSTHQGIEIRNVIGPGGQSVMHDTDGDLLVYHFYAANQNGTPELGLNLLGWTTSGWPYVM